MKTKSVLICGTGSGVGKSVLVTALCRIFLQDGHKVSPFKAQNMSLNSFVTKEGKEMGRAQVVQAEACRIAPHVDMNPILIKPTTDIGAQIIVQGKSIGNRSARQYQNNECKTKLFRKVKESFNRLKKEYAVIVMEGAGSPAEINLKSHDIVNMKMAEYACAPIILVGDIDKGGVFASLVGTLELLNEKERNLIKGFIINKFRGDKSLLGSGIRFLERKTKRPVLGIIPYFKDIIIPEEDGIYREKLNKICPLKIGVIKLPHLSNHTDFDIFEKEDVSFSYIDKPQDLENLDVAILPGTKNTIQDMKFLRKQGFEIAIKEHINKEKFLVGICGGFQMLGKRILDPLNIESKEENIEGLGYFDFSTIFKPEKITQQIGAEFIKNGLKITGYEIHHGKTLWKGSLRPMFIIEKRGDKKVKVYDGAHTKDFQIWGTHIHGVFDNYDFRNWFFNLVRKKRGLPAQKIRDNLGLDKEIDKLANLVRKNLDMPHLYKIVNKNV